MVTFEYIFYFVLFTIGITKLFNLSRKIIRFMNDTQYYSNETIFDGSSSNLTHSGTDDNDCNDSSFFDSGCDAGGGDGGGGD